MNTSKRKIDVGLCFDCAHAKEIPHPRSGESYWLCGQAEQDVHFAKYPRLPVLSCVAYTPESTEQVD